MQAIEIVKIVLKGMPAAALRSHLADIKRWRRRFVCYSFNGTPVAMRRAAAREAVEALL